MINKFFEVKAKYGIIDPSTGNEKMVTEPYLINAVSFTDGEASITKELTPYISGEFQVVGEKISEFSELIPSENGDMWFKCRVIFMAINEETGKVKETGIWVLVQADNVKEAYDNIEKAFEETVSEYRIKGVTESSIKDVFVDLESDDLPVKEDEKDVFEKAADKEG